MKMNLFSGGAFSLILAISCGGTAGVGSAGNGSTGSDGGLADAGAPRADGGTLDAGTPSGDAGVAQADAGTADAGVAQADAGTPDGLLSIALSQTDVHISAGTMTAFAVTGTYRDGMQRDITAQATPVSSNTGVATVSVGPGAQIQIYAISAGTASITVTVGSLQQTCAVTVSPR